MGKVSSTRHSADFKVRVALEASRDKGSLTEIGAKHGVHLSLVAGWKKGCDRRDDGDFFREGGCLFSAADVVKL